MGICIQTLLLSLTLFVLPWIGKHQTVNIDHDGKKNCNSDDNNDVLTCCDNSKYYYDELYNKRCNDQLELF